ncbi:MAG: 16S rRNA (adenine(1518)-N(6)/adenine(1519)-N(6))-dimethyltransferase RsmA [Candidatus Omnitrophota bacterium]
MKFKALQDLYNEFDFRPNKKLGQVFLIDENVLSKLARYADIKETDYLLEIGPGFGSLTRHLIGKAGKIIAVEKDKKLCVMIYEYLKINSSVIDVVCSDILDFDIDALMRRLGKKVKVIGNLPYYLTTPIILYLIKHKYCLYSMQLTIQKEVAQRLVAKPSSKEYGFLTLLVQFHFEVEKLFDISKNCFSPVPEVDSTALKLTVPDVARYKVGDEALLFKLIDLGFKQRRKTIANSLLSYDMLKRNKKGLMHLLDMSRIEYKKRAEDLSLEDYVRLTGILAKAHDPHAKNKINNNP